AAALFNARRAYSVHWPQPTQALGTMEQRPRPDRIGRREIDLAPASPFLRGLHHVDGDLAIGFNLGRNNRRGVDALGAKLLAERRIGADGGAKLVDAVAVLRKGL